MSNKEKYLVIFAFCKHIRILLEWFQKSKYDTKLLIHVVSQKDNKYCWKI